ncbi:Rfm1p LALA0_S01e05226g [Lachancea lanzarotensis]|uniref:LALA0S01e05226g1_1 n=1 Tax=Lachancea lanzarotensis TaxID=1245769 RepID=A0A0C7MK88_9SACH|nr:uncharacterized protein LALA0_S01e05226g [Lachancea lanzarotensis]CEP60198.1 LALA0S01e05226g1_1 [Lachancea lanzarotensis]
MNLLEGPLGSLETAKNSIKRESIDLGKPDELLAYEQWESPAEFTNSNTSSIYSNMSIEEKMAFNKKRRRQIFEETQELRTSINPLEFESYKDYFVLKKFKKGVSVSGRVGIGENRTRSTGVYYEKITRTGDNGSNDDDDSSQNSEGGRKEKSRHMHAQSSIVKQELSDSDSFPKSSPAPQSATNNNSNFFDTSISTSSIIPANSTDANVRRSSRLSLREREILEKKAIRLQEAGFEEENPRIVDLYESIIPKIISPVRRSDWLLPNKEQFIPEKFAPIKHAPEQIKINDLIHNSKLRRIMKRFKGGLAGVRKKDWDYGNESSRTYSN